MSDAVDPLSSTASLSLPALDEGQCSSLTSALLSTLRSSGIVGDDATDLVEYILIMTRNGRKVKEMVEELIDMDYCSREVNGNLGGVLHDFLVGLGGEAAVGSSDVGGESSANAAAGYNEVCDAAEDVIEGDAEEDAGKVVTIGGEKKKNMNALQMSGALGTGRKGKPKEKRTPIKDIKSKPKSTENSQHQHSKNFNDVKNKQYNNNKFGNMDRQQPRHNNLNNGNSNNMRGGVQNQPHNQPHNPRLNDRRGVGGGGGNLNNMGNNMGNASLRGTAHNAMASRAFGRLIKQTVILSEGAQSQGNMNRGGGGGPGRFHGSGPGSGPGPGRNFDDRNRRDHHPNDGFRRNDVRGGRGSGDGGNGRGRGDGGSGRGRNCGDGFGRGGPHMDRGGPNMDRGGPNMMDRNDGRRRMDLDGPQGRSGGRIGGGGGHMGHLGRGRLNGPQGRGNSGDDARRQRPPGASIGGRGGADASVPASSPGKRNNDGQRRGTDGSEPQKSQEFDYIDAGGRGGRGRLGGRFPGSIGRGRGRGRGDRPPVSLHQVAKRQRYNEGPPPNPSSFKYERKPKEPEKSSSQPGSNEANQKIENGSLNGKEKNCKDADNTNTHNITDENIAEKNSVAQVHPEDGIDSNMEGQSYPEVYRGGYFAGRGGRGRGRGRGGGRGPTAPGRVHGGRGAVKELIASRTWCRPRSMAEGLGTGR